jgi:hypothetical protein
MDGQNDVVERVMVAARQFVEADRRTLDRPFIGGQCALDQAWGALVEAVESLEANAGLGPVNFALDGDADARGESCSVPGCVSTQHEHEEAQQSWRIERLRGALMWYAEPAAWEGDFGPDEEPWQVAAAALAEYDGQPWVPPKRQDAEPKALIDPSAPGFSWGPWTPDSRPAVAEPEGE